MLGADGALRAQIADEVTTSDYITFAVVGVGVPLCFLWLQTWVDKMTQVRARLHLSGIIHRKASRTPTRGAFARCRI